MFSPVPKTEGNMVVSVCIAHYRVVAIHVRNDYFYARQGRYVTHCVCLSVCLSVSNFT